MAVRIAACGLALGLSLHMNLPASAQATPSVASQDIDPGVDREGFKDPPGLQRLRPTASCGSMPRTKRVVLEGEVCLREGQLEMFACLKGTKEHEAIVAVPTKAHVVHAALVALRC